MNTASGRQLRAAWMKRTGEDYLVHLLPFLMLDIELLVVGWLLEHFKFTPAEGEIALSAILPEELRDHASGGMEVLPTVDTLILLAKKQPLGRTGRDRLLYLLGFAASKDFLGTLWNAAEKVNTSDTTFKQHFPILTRLALLAREEAHTVYLYEIHRDSDKLEGGEVWSYTPGLDPLPEGELNMLEETASRYERLLEGMGWFIRNYTKAYGREAAEKIFKVSGNLNPWLACAVCYARGFDFDVPAQTQVYYGHKSHKPQVGEPLKMHGRGLVVTEVTQDKQGRVVSFKAESLPPQNPTYHEKVEKWLNRKGRWLDDEERGKRQPYEASIDWGAYRPGAGGGGHPDSH